MQPEHPYSQELIYKTVEMQRLQLLRPREPGAYVRRTQGKIKKTDFSQHKILEVLGQRSHKATRSQLQDFLNKSALLVRGVFSRIIDSCDKRLPVSSKGHKHGNCMKIVKSATNRTRLADGKQRYLKRREAGKICYPKGI